MLHSAGEEGARIAHLLAAVRALICSSSRAASPAPALVSAQAWAATSLGRSVTALVGPAPSSLSGLFLSCSSPSLLAVGFT